MKYFDFEAAYIKIWGGPAVVMTIIAIAVAITFISTKQLKWASMPIKANQCILAGDATSRDCISLSEYGIDPDAYVQNSNYRKAVDAYQQKVVRAGAKVLPPLADFVLETAGSRGAKRVIKGLNVEEDSNV